MKSFRMMLLPAIVGTLLLFCGTPTAGATSCDLSSIMNFPLTESPRVMAEDFLDLKSLLTAESRSAPAFSDLAETLQLTMSQLILAYGRTDRIWVLAIPDVPASAVKNAATGSSTSLLPLAALETATTVTTTTTSVPEAPSLLYLGSGLILCGGVWLRRRRF